MRLHRTAVPLQPLGTHQPVALAVQRSPSVGTNVWLRWADVGPQNSSSTGPTRRAVSAPQVAALSALGACLPDSSFPGSVSRGLVVWAWPVAAAEGVGGVPLGVCGLRLCL